MLIWESISALIRLLLKRNLRKEGFGTAWILASRYTLFRMEIINPCCELIPRFVGATGSSRLVLDLPGKTGNGRRQLRPAPLRPVPAFTYLFHFPRVKSKRARASAPLHRRSTASYGVRPRLSPVSLGHNQ